MELMEVYHEALATRIIARVTNGKCEGAEFVFGLIESAIRKEATEILLMVRMDSVARIVTIGSPTLPGLSLRTWQSILSSLVTSPRKKQAPKDYSADQTEGSTICNSEECAYLTTSPLSSSTSNQSDPGLRFRTRCTGILRDINPPHLVARRREVQIGLRHDRHKK